jgi:hypothetical protein
LVIHEEKTPIGSTLIIKGVFRLPVPFYIKKNKKPLAFSQGDEGVQLS